MEGEALGMLTALGAVAASVVLWLQYWDLKDRLHPEPRRLLFVAFLAGIASVPLALGAFKAAAFLGLPATPGDTPAMTALFCFAVVGPVEEGSKFALARLVPFRFKAFDETIDGLVYGAAVALGFASVETLLYAPNLPAAEAVIRAIASPLTHTVFAAVWALPTARVLVHRTSAPVRFGVQLIALALAAGLHGAYDYLVLAHNATALAAGIIAVVWCTAILVARRVVHGGAT